MIELWTGYIQVEEWAMLGVEEWSWGMRWDMRVDCEQVLEIYHDP